jgi:hypothetical protein
MTEIQICKGLFAKARYYNTPRVTLTVAEVFKIFENWGNLYKTDSEDDE